MQNTDKITGQNFILFFRGDASKKKCSSTYCYRIVSQFLAIILVVLSFFSCKKNDKIDIKSFYFPINDLKNGLVYEYRPIKNDSLPPYYWLYKTIENDQKFFFLTGTYYNYNFDIQQLTTEEVVKNGTLLNDLFIYQKDNQGKLQQQKVSIDANNVYPFEVTDSTGVFFYKIHWRDQNDTATTYTVIRNRRFKGFSTYSFQGKTVDCVEFELQEAIQNTREGSLEVTARGKELYAKNIGLIYSKKVISDKMTLEYGLYDRYGSNKLKQ